MEVWCTQDNGLLCTRVRWPWNSCRIAKWTHWCIHCNLLRWFCRLTFPLRSLLGNVLNRIDTMYSFLFVCFYPTAVGNDVLAKLYGLWSFSAICYKTDGLAQSHSGILKISSLLQFAKYAPVPARHCGIGSKCCYQTSLSIVAMSILTNDLTKGRNSVQTLWGCVFLVCKNEWAC